ncbi:MAG: general secretion pathway protein GspK [Thermoguttaceae bacterium]|nr:general secretion pathway protein GspK [Thermoguttaceae bacterium]
MATSDGTNELSLILMKRNKRTAARATRRLGRRSNRDGVVLLIVALVVAALTLGGATLLTLMQTERAATQTRGYDALVRSVDRSAVAFLVGTLETSPEERDKIGGVYDNPSYFCAAPLLTFEDGGTATSRFTIVSPKFEEDEIEGVRYGLVDESTRLNLDAVLAWEAEKAGAGRDALLKLPGMTEVAADSILDWIDADETARSNGGETRYYTDEKLPYSPRNAVPVFLEELLLARGVTRLHLYGTDENFTFGVENIDGGASEDSALGGSLTAIPVAGGSRRRGEAEAVPWKELLTVFSAEKDVDPTGEARVDLNVADLEFLYQELAPRVGEELAKFVVWARQFGPTSGVDAKDAEGNPVPRGRLETTEVDFSVPASFTLATPLDVVGTSVLVGGTAIESPLAANRSNSNAEKIFQLLDFASTSPSTTIVGRVNVNAAPRPVLAAVPGLATADVQRILDDRPALDEAIPDDYRHATWLYTKGVVDWETMKAIYDKTTARGDVYRAQIVGFLDGVNVSARAEVVVDGTTEPPRQVFYKDLSMNGKGFSDAILLGGSAVESGDPLASGAAWDALDQATSGLFEIETPGSAADPFAELDRQTGYRFDAPSVPNATAGADAAANVDALDAGLGTGLETSATGASDLASTPQTLEETDPLGVPIGEIGAETGSETATPAAPTSRRDQLMNALQTMRSNRRWRNSNAPTDGNAAPEAAGADSATPPPLETETPAASVGALDASGTSGRGGASGGGGRTSGRGGASETPPF